MSEFTTFKDAFSALQRNANTLRSQQEPNIDELLPLVQQSMDAYRICKARIDAVDAAMRVEFGEEPDNLCNLCNLCNLDKPDKQEVTGFMTN